MWILKVPESGGAENVVFRLLPGSVRTLGRAPVADFVLDAPMVSRVHCRLAVSAAGLLEVEDLESTNGTYVNDRRVTRSVLISGDRLRVGRVEMAVSRAVDSEE
jgi:pSer/pThr/pTyr-binding forkhead associated (FHA) protein